MNDREIYVAAMATVTFLWLVILLHGHTAVNYFGQERFSNVYVTTTGDLVIDNYTFYSSVGSRLTAYSTVFVERMGFFCSVTFALLHFLSAVYKLRKNKDFMVVIRPESGGFDEFLNSLAIAVVAILSLVLILQRTIFSNFVIGKIFFYQYNVQKHVIASASNSNVLVETINLK